jgi:hypothetical protein
MFAVGTRVIDRLVYDMHGKIVTGYVAGIESVSCYDGSMLVTVEWDSIGWNDYRGMDSRYDDELMLAV